MFNSSILKNSKLLSDLQIKKWDVLRFHLIAQLVLMIATPVFAREWLGFAGPPVSGSYDAVYVETGDFNSDGIVDLVVVNDRTANISILLGIRGRTGKGNGAFFPPVQYSTGSAKSSPRSVATDDFNGDGITDFAVSDYGLLGVVVLLGHGDENGRGDGSFGDPVLYDVNSRPNSVITGDFNEDGITDIVTGHHDSVSVLLGNGDGVGNGTFAAQMKYSAGSDVRSVVKGDFNGDGIVDLATANFEDNEVSILLGNEVSPGIGDGTFSAPIGFAVGTSPIFITAADFNNDGLLDLATANYDSANLSVLLNKSGDAPDGMPLFATAANYGVGYRPSSLITADFNGDGLLDLATTSPSWDSSVSVLLGTVNSKGAPGIFLNMVSYLSNGGPSTSVTSADFNGDGVLDLVTAHRWTNDVSILLGNSTAPTHGDGTFAPGYTSGFIQEVGDAPTCLAAGDFDGDHITDLAVGLSAENLVAFFSGVSDVLGYGIGTFRRVGSLRIEPLFSSTPRVMESADLNGDGFPDLVTADWVGRVSIFLNRADGSGAFNSRKRYFVCESTTGVAIADLNGDGIPDLTTSNESNDTVSVLLAIDDGTGRGSGNFTPPVYYPVEGSPRGIATGDFNSDGFTDIVSANEDSHTVAIIAGRGDGTFSGPNYRAVGLGPVGVSVGDFNGDGVLDLVTSNFDSDNITVLLGNQRTTGGGDGTFSAAAYYDVGSGPRSVTTGDFNHDGILDIASANSGSDSVSVLLGKQTGGFMPPLNYNSPRVPFSVIAADFNNDGFLDLATANSESDDMTVLMNQGLTPPDYEDRPTGMFLWGTARRPLRGR